MAEERKLVTVLFADVTGSTSLGEELDPEDVRALMGHHYDHARTVVADHGGTLEKFIGDAVMAVFGLPHAHGDDAERAVAAALALRQAVTEDADLPDVELRIGITTGEVVGTTDPAAGDFLVTGDAVNVAARLQQFASPGEILASERTYAAAGAVFMFSDAREVEVKGKREPLRVFPVVGAREVRQRVRPPMVGREDDLSMLSLIHRRTLHEGRPQLVSIVAPAGTGKTRLLEEFLLGLDPGGVRAATSRCLPYGQTLTYWPLRGLMEELLGDVDRGLVVNAFDRAGHTPEDASRLADLVLAPLGKESETLTERESVFSAWRLLAEALAQREPLVIVFEDLHWASDSLLDLVEQVMHPRARAPLLLIAISRPELLDRRPAWGAGARQNFTTLVLEPLLEEATDELVSTLAPRLPEAIRHRIVERSGGNPYFVTELVRGLAERGIGDAEAMTDAIPDTVRAAVLARLDLLEATERRVLQAAAVGGRLFRPAIVHAVLADLGARDLDAAIDDLLSRDLIVPDEGGAFTFRHILIRDVAYGTLSRIDRARMHLAVALWLEGFAQGRFDEYAELIAYHYQEALSLSRRLGAKSDVSVDPAHAVVALERAAEVARRAGATTEARGYLHSAIAVTEDREHGRLYERLGDAEAWGERALEAYREALDRWRRDGESDPGTGARLLSKILTVYLRWSGGSSRPKVEELAEIRGEARRLAEIAGEDALWRFRAADVFWPNSYRFSPARSGLASPEEREACRATALEAAAYFEERGEWELFSAALDGYMANSTRLGLREDVIVAGRRRLAAPQLSAVERGDALQMMGVAYCEDWKYGAALDLCHDAIASLRPGDAIGHLAYMLNLGAVAAYVLGRWAEIDAFVSMAEDVRQQQDEEQAAPWLMPVYVEALTAAMAREDRTAADAWIAAARRLASVDAEWSGVMLPEAEAIRADDPSLLDLRPDIDVGNAPKAGVLWFLNDRGIAAPDVVMKHADTWIASLSGGLGASIISVARAIRERNGPGLAAEIAALQVRGLTPIAARLQIVLADMTGDPAPLDSARTVLERLGDRQFLRRLEEVAAALR